MKTYRYYSKNLNPYMEEDDLLIDEIEAHNLGEADRIFQRVHPIELPDATISTWEKQ